MPERHYLERRSCLLIKATFRKPATFSKYQGKPSTLDENSELPIYSHSWGIYTKFAHLCRALPGIGRGHFSHLSYISSHFYANRQPFLVYCVGLTLRDARDVSVPNTRRRKIARLPKTEGRTQIPHHHRDSNPQRLVPYELSEIYLKD